MRTAALVLLALAACATARPPPRWLPADGPYLAASPGFEVSLPPGWMRQAGTADRLVLTRDGPSLQRIQIASSEVGGPLGLGKGTHVLAAGTTPEGLADLFTDDLRSTVPDVRVLERGPAKLSGRDAIQVIVSYLDERGLRRRAAFRGVVDGGRAWHLLYLAPERHYFALDLPAFEELARSFRVVPAAPAGPAAR
jgi:hypothetical protein